jgi:hypothetical protein
MLSGFTGWHLIILSIVFLIPFALAAVSIARSRTASGSEKAVWVLVILLFPLLGPILWFAIGRRSSRGRPERTQ